MTLISLGPLLILTTYSGSEVISTMFGNWLDERHTYYYPEMKFNLPCLPAYLMYDVFELNGVVDWVSDEYRYCI